MGKDELSHYHLQRLSSAAILRNGFCEKLLTWGSTNCCLGWVEGSEEDCRGLLILAWFFFAVCNVQTCQVKVTAKPQTKVDNTTLEVAKPR